MSGIRFDDRRVESLTIKDALSTNGRLSIAHKFDQRLYNWGSKQLNSLITKTYKRFNETNFLVGFDSTERTNLRELESTNSDDYYALHQMTIFGKFDKFLTDGQQRSVTILFLLNILKNKLIELKGFDESEKIGKLVDLINSIIFVFDPSVDDRNNDEVISNCDVRISYIDMENYNKIFENLLRNNFDKVEDIISKENDNLNLIYFKKLKNAYDEIENLINIEILKDTKNENEQINILYRYSRFLITRCYFDIVSIDKYDPIRRLEEFITINTDGLPLGIFDIYKVLMAKKIQNKKISEELISRELIETFKNLEESLSYYDCDSNKKVKDLLYLHYMVKYGKTTLRKSEILDDISDISNNEDPVLESSELRNTAEILHHINNKQLPNNFKNKFIYFDSVINQVEDTCHRIHSQEREYSKLFLLVVYKNLESFSDIKTLLYIFKRFNTFISKFSSLGNGGKSATDVRNAIIKFRKVLIENKDRKEIIKNFEKIFFEDNKIKNKFSVNTAIDQLMDKNDFSQEKTSSKNKRILLDIEYENSGGFTTNTEKINIDSSNVTKEHILSVSKNLQNPLINNLGNMGGFLTTEQNSKLSEKLYSEKKELYKGIKSATLNKIANKYKNDDFTTSDIIENSADHTYTYLKSIDYWLKLNPNNFTELIEDVDLHNLVKTTIESKKISMLNTYVK